MKCRGFEVVDILIGMAVVAIIAAVALPSAIQNHNTTPERQAEQLKSQLQQNQDYYIGRIGYIKDKDTGLCFAIDMKNNVNPIIGAVECLAVRDKLP